ncbi:hypothetical protein ACJJTC_015318 [Scirpophaga incertulas]
MRVSALDNKNKNEANNSIRPLPFLNTMLTIFGLSCEFHQRCQKYLCTFYFFYLAALCTLFGFASVFVLTYKMEFVNKTLNKSIMLTDTIQTVYDYFQYIVDIVYSFRYGRFFYHVYAKQYSTVDRILGKEMICIAIEERFKKSCIFLMMLWFLSSLCDFSAWVLGYGWIIPIVYSLSYVFVLIKILTTLDLTSNIMHIQFRVRTISDIIQNYYNSAKCLPGMAACDTVRNNDWFYCNGNSKKKDGSDAQNDSNLNKEEINKFHFLSACYLLIIEQCSYINQMFGMRILLNSLSLFIDMVKCLNLVIRMMVGSQHTLYNAGYFPILSTIVRLLTCIMILSIVVIHCEKTYRESDRIVSLIDNLVIIKDPDVGMRETMSDLRNLVQSRPINFHLANVLRLDYSLMASMASVVTTYTIILLQTIT